MKLARAPTDASELLRQAIALQQFGRLTEARAKFKSLLKIFPNHPQILSSLGTIALQQGDVGEGVQCLGKYLKIVPNQPIVLTNYAVGLYLLKRLDEALSAFDQAIALKPDYPDAYSNRGNVLKDLGRLDQALASYERAVELQPDSGVAHGNRGAALLDLGRLDEALRSYDRAIALQPDFAQAFSNRGRVLKGLGRSEDALASYDRAIAFQSDFAEAHYHRGALLLELQRFEEALAAFDQAIAFNPDYVEAHSNRGAVLERLKRPLPGALKSCERAVAQTPPTAGDIGDHGALWWDSIRLNEALACFDRIIALRPHDAEAHTNRGVILEQLKRSDEALAAYDRAISFGPNYAPAYSNRGTARQKRGRLQDALADYERAIVLNPDYVEAHTNRGGVMNELMRLDEALASYDRAIGLRPDYPPACVGKSFVRLLRGEFEDGFKLLEWRWKEDQLKEHARDFLQPQWFGEQPIEGKTLLIHSEQGYGDFIQFCRYVPLARSMGARIVLEVLAPLLALAGTLEGNGVVVQKGMPLPAFDLHCPILSLPLAFATSVATVPSRIPYLRSDPARRERWQQQLGKRTGPRIGLAWSGSIAHKNDRNRSLSLAQLQPVLELPFEFHSIQKDVRPEDARFLADSPIIDHADDLVDFADAAALVEEMDLVICVDTSLAHLAGALGKPVWILLPFAPDYRWMVERDDSPWYPTARLFRQPGTGAWASVIAQVAQRLRELETSAAESIAVPGVRAAVSESPTCL